MFVLDTPSAQNNEQPRFTDLAAAEGTEASGRAAAGGL